MISKGKALVPASRRKPKEGHVKGRKNGRSGISCRTSEAVVTVATLGHRGHGIAETDTERIFVPFSLPTETVRVKVTGGHGEIIEIIEAAGDRINPVCPHFGQCGGCAVQHMQEGAYYEWKRGIVTTALLHQGLDVDVEPVIDAHGLGRRRATLHVMRHGGLVQVGFMQAKSHNLSDIHACPVLAPAFSDAIALAHELGNSLFILARGLDVQLAATEAGLDCHVISARSIRAGDHDQHMALADLAERYDLARLTLDGEMVVERRKPQVRIGDALVTVPVGAFLQATQEGERVLSRLVMDHMAIVNPQSVADLFCGIGPYALRLAEQARVFAVDNSAASIEALAAAVRHTQNLKPVETVARDLFDNPLTVDELNGFNLVVFNPPRAGASAQAAEIALSQVPDVIAVSCDPATFARDARVLVEGGYGLKRVTPVDQFKWSAHMEVVGLFRRG